MKTLRVSFGRFFLSLVIGGVALFTFVRAEAHAGGASFIATTTSYVIDVGYDPVTFTAGQYTRFDFILKDEKTGDPAAYDQIWVRIKDDDGTLLATGLFHQPIGPTTLLYVFSEPGLYNFQPSFRDADGSEVAAASFPITVQASQQGPSTYEILLGCAALLTGVVLGAVLALLFIRKREYQV